MAIGLAALASAAKGAGAASTATTAATAASAAKGSKQVPFMKGPGGSGLIGGIMGGIMQPIEMNAEQKARERAETTAEFGFRPNRRRIKRLENVLSSSIADATQNKQRALIAIAQAHQNYASMW